MPLDDVEITIVDRQDDPQTSPADGDSVDYLPFGIKVLKLQVRRNPATKPDLGPIRIHPQNYLPPDGDSEDPQRWRVYGTAANDPDLWVVWGAGHDQGFSVKMADQFVFNKVAAPLDDDGTYYIYLHLIHRPADPFAHTPTDKTLTILATDKQRGIRGQKTVRLTVPQGTSNPLRAHWQAQGGVSTITFHGADGSPAQLPRYVSRWWPVRRVAYDPVDDKLAQFLQDLEIRYQRQVDGSKRGRIDLSLDGTQIAQVTGDLEVPVYDRRLCSMEPFRFVDDHHLVLRLWFYWADLGFAESEELKPKGLLGAIAGAILPWRKVAEVPDVERFDLVLDPDDQTLKHKYMCTDTHWQEFWAGNKAAEALELGIATLTDIPKLKKLADSVPEIEGPVHDPLANGLCDIVNELSHHECPFRQQVPGELITADARLPGIEYKVCPRCGTYFRGQDVRAVGLWGKHAPLVANADVLDGLTSTSVLEG
jgi:hypothetical protein